MSTPGKTAQNPLTPSVLNQMLKKHLSDQFGSFWLTGEVFDCYRSPAGHNYFTLKDHNAGIKCVMFRQKQISKIDKGMQVTVLGQMTLYTPKGDVQVNVQRLIEAGQGDLAQQFAILKQKLMNVGLFEQSNKSPIPKIIGSLAIVTSPKGAALQDILNVLIKNNPLIEITIYPTLVQGKEAPPQINHALRQADENGHDLILLTRGGGSKEDLWAFNDEFMAHQIAQLKTPIISAVGHETDESISDLVADISCITPTAAAHFIAGDFNQMKQNLVHNNRLLTLLAQEKLRVYQQKIDSAFHQIEKHHPENTIQRQQEALNHHLTNLNKTLNNRWHHTKSHFKQLHKSLQSCRPETIVEQQKLKAMSDQLNWEMSQTMSQARQKLNLAVNDLNHQNPLEILARGYSVTTQLTSGSVISDVSQVKVGDEVATQLNSGRIHAKIFERLED